MKAKFKEGDKVCRSGNGSKHYGIVTRAFKEGANVEWVGFPPCVPQDGYQTNEGLFLRPPQTAGQPKDKL